MKIKRGSRIVFDSNLVEVLEAHAIFPSFLQLWDVVGWLHCDYFRIDTLWHAQLVKVVWLHEQSESVT